VAIFMAEKKICIHLKNMVYIVLQKEKNQMGL
jgi:hypothetical protein